MYDAADRGQNGTADLHEFSETRDLPINRGHVEGIAFAKLFGQNGVEN
ncbi:MAG: hypothetical protein ACJASX_003921 [Limisphaerales bacterium]